MVVIVRYKQLDLQLPVQSVPISPLKLWNSNPTHCEMYSIQHYVIKFVSDLRQVVVYYIYYIKIINKGIKNVWPFNWTRMNRSFFECVNMFFVMNFNFFCFSFSGLSPHFSLSTYNELSPLCSLSLCTYYLYWPNYRTKQYLKMSHQLREDSFFSYLNYS